MPEALRNIGNAWTALPVRQRLRLVVAVLATLGVMAVFKWKRRARENRNLYLSIDWSPESGSRSENQLDRLSAFLRFTEW